MGFDLANRFVIAVSSRAVLDLSKENRLFEWKGTRFFNEYQTRHRDRPPDPGPAFPLVQSILALNQLVDGRPIEVVLMSKNSPSASIRVHKALESHRIDIQRSWFTSGDPVSGYLQSANVDLFLSADPADVKSAHASGIAAALIHGVPKQQDSTPSEQVRIAFDGDAVLFAEESERIYKEHGLAEFQRHESERASEPMADGPFARVYRALGDLRKALPDEESWRIKIGLFTARNAPSHMRVLETVES